jgi:DNA-directed RNA polymerase subunit RPC12/RpoP
MLCLNCGSEKFEYKTKKKLRGGNGERYYYPSCECKDCGHEAHLDYCWYCRTKLFKHGRYWDYHRTSAWSIFDIHCPNCGMTVADRPQLGMD